MKKLLLLSILVLLISLVLPDKNVEARSGCCSWHGGVCSYQCPGGGVGYRCCDGTSLSAKCAPYYPSCSSVPKSIQQLPQTQEEPKVEDKESDLSKLKAQVSEELLDKENIDTQGNKEGSIWWWIIGLGIIGYLFYIFKKKK